MQCVPLIIRSYCFSIYLPLLPLKVFPLRVRVRKEVRAFPNRHQQKLFRVENKSLFVRRRRTAINDSAHSFIWHKWHTQMNNARGEEGKMSMFELFVAAGKFIGVFTCANLRLAINISIAFGVWRTVVIRYDNFVNRKELLVMWFLPRITSHCQLSLRSLHRSFRSLNAGKLLKSSISMGASRHLMGN